MADRVPTGPAPNSASRPGNAAAGERPPRFSTQSAYSRFVTAMKLVLPALAVGIVLLVLVWPQIGPGESGFRVGLSELSPESADQLTMVNPRFQGRDSQDRPFSIVAQEATQPADDGRRITLDGPKADITLDNGAWVALTADSGVYHRDDQTLELSGNVSLFHDRGFELRTARTHIDLQTGNARSNAPVQGQGPAGTLSAQGFRFTDGGRTIVFTGRSRLTVFGDGDQP